MCFILLGFADCMAGVFSIGTLVIDDIKAYEQGIDHTKGLLLLSLYQEATLY